MKKPSEEILKAIGELSEDLIAESSEEALALEKKKRKKKIIYISSGSAVAAAVLLFLVWQVFPWTIKENSGMYFAQNVAMDWSGDAAYEAASEANGGSVKSGKYATSKSEKSATQSNRTERGDDIEGMEEDPEEIGDQSVTDYKNNGDSTTLDEEDPKHNNSDYNPADSEMQFAPTSAPAVDDKKESSEELPKSDVSTAKDDPEEEQPVFTKAPAVAPGDREDHPKPVKPTATPKPTAKPKLDDADNE